MLYSFDRRLRRQIFVTYMSFSLEDDFRNIITDFVDLSVNERSSESVLEPVSFILNP